MKPNESNWELLAGLTGHGSLCGLRFDEDSDYPDIYTILLQDREYSWPIVSGGRPLFFTRLELARTALEMDDDPLMRTALLPEITIYETYIYDIPEILAMIERDNSDQKSLLLDFLNVLLDLVSATKLQLPATYPASFVSVRESLDSP